MTSKQFPGRNDASRQQASIPPRTGLEQPVGNVQNRARSYIRKRPKSGNDAFQYGLGAVQ